MWLRPSGEAAAELRRYSHNYPEPERQYPDYAVHIIDPLPMRF
jgi:hypothetical protein